jgi:hypothetical protein
MFTPFVLYDDGTVISGGVVYRKGHFAGWRHSKHHLDTSAVAELKRSLGWEKLLDMESRHSPIAKEEARWIQQHHCSGGCWPQLNLYLWSEGWRKTISIAGLDSNFMQLITLGRDPELHGNDVERFALARLAFKRLPKELKLALKHLASYRRPGGEVWCQEDECQEKSLPRQESWR